MCEPSGAWMKVGVGVVYSWVMVLVVDRYVLAIFRPSVSARWRYPWGLCGSVPDMEGMGREVGDCTKMAVRHQRAQ